jgi:RND family efflux transporter MFP subunit
MRQPSSMLARHAIAPLAVGVLVLLSGCGDGPGDAEPRAERASDIATVEVGAHSGSTELRVSGVVEALSHATLSAQTGGRVTAALVDVDDAVRSGQLLMRLRSTEQVAGLDQADAALTAAVAREAQARSHFDRIADMYERKVVARATYDEALAARDAAAANVTAARAGLASAREGVAYTELRAPFDGVVTARHVESGETVAPGMPLLAISGSGALRVVAAVPQSAFDQVRAVGKANVYAGERQVESSRVTVFPAADAASGTFRARVDLPAGAIALAPGMHVEVGFVTGESRRVSVPRRAVVERSELRAVYVVLPDGQVSLRQVRLGRASGEEVEVIAGLAPGERIATDPASAGLLARPTVTSRDSHE